MKVTLSFRERFWEDPQIVGPGQSFNFVLCPDAVFPTFWTTQPLLESVLVAWASGPAADKLVGRSREEIRRAAIQSLSVALHMTPAKIASQFISMHFHDWSVDPFARGAYSYPAVGGLAAAQKLAEPLDETLFFAGEATDFQGANGTVHAAIASGYRAAREFLMGRS